MILAFEGLAAQLTGEAALVAMRQLVLGQRRRTRKHLRTHLLTISTINNIVWLSLDELRLPPLDGAAIAIDHLTAITAASCPPRGGAPNSSADVITPFPPTPP